MSKNVTLWGASYTGVPSLEVPQTGGGTATFTDTSPTTATAADVATGKTFFLADGTQATGQLSGGSTIIVDEEGEHGDTIRHITTGETVEGSTTITTNGTHDVAHYASAVVNVPSSAPSLQSKTATYTPTESTQTATISADSGYDGLSSVDVTVNAVSSTYVGSGITQRSSSSLTASGATVTVPAGYYSTEASKSVSTATQATPSVSVNSYTGLVTATATQTAGYVSAGSKSGTLQLTTQGATTITPSTSQQTAVAAGTYTTGAVTVSAMPSGTAGTPTATKGTVSNNSVSVTPSVTNTTGYITGSTLTGTAVTVSASELVSGTLSITENGTADVTNYASVNVDVASSVKHTATITSAGNWSEREYLGVYVEYDGTKYYSAGSTFEFDSGDTASIRFAMRDTSDITLTVNGEEVVNTTANLYTYSYTLPNKDVAIGLMSYGNNPCNVTIYEKETVIVKPLIADTNGAYSETGVAYSPVVVNVSGGGGVSGVAKGTFTVAEDQTATTDITTTEDIGFVPTKFFLYRSDKATAINGRVYVAAYVGEYAAEDSVRIRGIYNSQSEVLTVAQTAIGWSSLSSGHLSLQSGVIKYSATSSYILGAGTYEWIAVE